MSSYQGNVLSIFGGRTTGIRDNRHQGKVLSFIEKSATNNEIRNGRLIQFLHKSDLPEPKTGKIMSFATKAIRPEGIIQNIIKQDINTPRQSPLEISWKSKNNLK